MSINHVTISGNLTRDAELRATPGGTSVLSFGVAVHESVKGSDGQWTDRPNFVDCTMFGARAEGIAQYLAKGTKVAVSGKLRYSAWERDGQHRSKLEVVVDDIEFMSRKPAPSQQPQPAQYATVPQPQYTQAPMPPQPPMRQPMAPSAQQPPAPQRTVQTRVVQNQPVQPPQYAQPAMFDEDIPF